MKCIVACIALLLPAASASAQVKPPASECLAMARSLPRVMYANLSHVATTNGEVTITDRAGTKEVVTPWDHPFGVANQGLDTAMPRANYRNAGLSDMMTAFETGRHARCDLDVALHAVDVLTSILRAGETGQVITLSTTCERPAALGPDEARSMLR